MKFPISAFQNKIVKLFSGPVWTKILLEFNLFWAEGEDLHRVDFFSKLLQKFLN